MHVSHQIRFHISHKLLASLILSIYFYLLLYEDQPGLNPPRSTPPKNDTMLRIHLLVDQGMALKHIPPRIQEEARKRLDRPGNSLNLSV